MFNQNLFKIMLEFEQACILPDLKPTPDIKNIDAKFRIYYLDPVNESIIFNPQEETD